MFIDSRVTHVKFGDGIITDIEINPNDQLKSKISVSFDSGKVSKFSMNSFGRNGFFTVDDDSVIKFIDNLREEEKNKSKVFVEINKKKNIIKHSNVDEFDNFVSKDRWERAAKVAGSYRFPGESRAVVANNDMIFINATSGLRFFELDIKYPNYVYERCDGKKKNKYGNCTWRYASKEEIDNIIETINNDIK